MAGQMGTLVRTDEDLFQLLVGEVALEIRAKLLRDLPFHHSEGLLIVDDLVVVGIVWVGGLTRVLLLDDEAEEAAAAEEEAVS